MRSPAWRGDNNDFYSGLLLVAVASVALLYIRTLAIGTVLQMGPGYFPLGLALVLLGMGLCLLAKGLLTGEKPVGIFHLRSLFFILLSYAVFCFIKTQSSFI